MQFRDLHYNYRIEHLGLAPKVGCLLKVSSYPISLFIQSCRPKKKTAGHKPYMRGYRSSDIAKQVTVTGHGIWVTTCILGIGLHTITKYSTECIIHATVRRKWNFPNSCPYKNRCNLQWPQTSKRWLFSGEELLCFILKHYDIKIFWAP